MAKHTGQQRGRLLAWPRPVCGADGVASDRVFLCRSPVTAQDAAAGRIPAVRLAEAPRADRAATASDWPLPRGDAQSSGATKTAIVSPLAVAWEFQADEAIETSPVVSGGRVFVSDVFGRIYAINQSMASEVWKKDYKTGFMASPAIQDNLIVIGDVEGTLYGLDATDGRELWKRATDGEINGSAAFYHDKVLVDQPRRKAVLFRRQRWFTRLDIPHRRPNPLQPNHRGKPKRFWADVTANLHVVDLKTGKAIGQPLPLGGPTGSTPAVVG